MTQQQTQICQAIEGCPGDYLSEAEEARIARDYGPEIAKEARKVYEAAIGCPVDWSNATMDDGLLVLAQVCRDHYPWLTEEARLKLVHWFVLAWK